MGKPRFIDDPNVKRWMRQHATTAPPMLPVSMRDYGELYWIKPALWHFMEKGLIADLLQVIRPGKEATVYLCQAGPLLDLDYLALKAYSPTMMRRFTNDATYQTGRAFHDARQFATKNPRARNGAFVEWITYEAQTHAFLAQHGALIPRHFGMSGNSVLMEFIGDEQGAAPMLSDVKIEREEAQPLFDQLLHNVRLFLTCNRIHGDLSPYNILYWQGKVKIIDFGRAVDPRHAKSGYNLLLRDIERLRDYFAPYGLSINPERLAGRLWSRYHRGQLTLPPTQNA